MTTQMAVEGGGPPPTTLAANASAGGGTFAGGVAQYWKITYIDGNGFESNGSNEATCTPAASGKAVLTWDTPPPSTLAVKVYRGTSAGAEDHIIAVLASSGPASAVPATWTDTGTAGVGATVPAVAFASVTLNANGTVAKTSTGLSGIAAGRLGRILEAANMWRSAAGSGAAATLAQAIANAAGFTLQEI